jgi:23S rRNA (pseudouridine1915-N3)-methyltransferase
VKLHICAIGKLKEGAERELAGQYFERAAQLGRQAGISSLTVTEHAESQAKTADLRKADEAARLLGSFSGLPYVIALDERGRDMSSTKFAGEIRKLLDNGTRETAILIGGPDGHAPAVHSRAGLVLSFGKLTWPHRLVRVMLAEQIYWAVTILVNHPYHRD